MGWGGGSVTCSWLDYSGMSLKKAVCSDDKLLESTVTNGGHSELFFFFFFLSTIPVFMPPVLLASIPIKR